jgi:hypothetical protein
MKTILTALTLFLAVSLSASAQTWNSAGILTNPAANTIMADSGPQNEGLRAWSVVCSATGSAQLIVEHRNATDTANVPNHTQGLLIAANGYAPLNPAAGIFFLQDERIRVRANAAVAGAAQCSVWVE